MHDHREESDNIGTTHEIRPGEWGGWLISCDDTWHGGNAGEVILQIRPLTR